MVEVDGDEVGEPSDADRTTLDPEACRPVDRRDIEQGTPGSTCLVDDGAPHLMTDPLNVFDPSKIFSRGDSTIEIGPDRDRNTQFTHRGEIADSVPEISFGVRTETDSCPGGCEILKILGIRMRAMDRGSPFVDHPVIEGEPHRRPIVDGEAVVNLLHNLFQMKVKDRPSSCGFCVDGRNAIDRDRSSGMRYRSHRLQRSFRNLLRTVKTREVGLQRSSVEANLSTREWTIIESGADVIAMKKNDANAGIPSRSKDGAVEHPPGVLFLVGGVMDVMKLANGSDAGVEHLLEGRPARAIGPLGIERCDQLVHGRTPGKKRALALAERLTLPPHPTLEGMTVSIDETGQDRH